MSLGIVRSRLVKMVNHFLYFEQARYVRVIFCFYDKGLQRLNQTRSLAGFNAGRGMWLI